MGSSGLMRLLGGGKVPKEMLLTSFGNMVVIYWQGIVHGKATHMGDHREMNHQRFLLLCHCGGNTVKL